MSSVPLSWLPLVGLLAIPSAIAFMLTVEPIAVVAILNTVLIVVAVRLMFGSDDLDTLEHGLNRIR